MSIYVCVQDKRACIWDVLTHMNQLICKMYICEGWNTAVAWTYTRGARVITRICVGTARLVWKTYTFYIPGNTSTHQHSVPVLLNVRVIFFHGLSPREVGPPILYYSPYIITIYSASRYAEIPLEYLARAKGFRRATSEGYVTRRTNLCPFLRKPPWRES